MSIATWKTYARERAGIVDVVGGRPVVLAWKLPDQPSTAGFYCQHCKRYHYHGASDGERVAHCVKPSPFKETGYVLKIAEPAQ